MNAILRPTGLSINGSTVAEAPSLENISASFGESAYREKELYDQGKQWRKFVILDKLGISLLFDYEIERVIAVGFWFELSKSPSSPHEVFSGLLFINGLRLVSGMKERTLPIAGEFQFSKQGGWTASSDKIFVEMRVSRSRKQLQAVDVSFLKHPAFARQK